MDGIQRGQMYLAGLDPVVGCEQGGVRPVLVIQNNAGNRHARTVIVAAVTSRCKPGLPTHVALPAAGVLTKVRIAGTHRLGLGEEYRFRAGARHMIALDGERELRVDPGEEVGFTVVRNGPWRVRPRAALGEAVRLGYFQPDKEGI